MADCETAALQIEFAAIDAAQRLIATEPLAASAVRWGLLDDPRLHVAFSTTASLVGITAGAGNAGVLRGVGFTRDRTNFINYMQDTSGTDGGINIKGFRLGLGKDEAQITAIITLTDTSTGEIALGPTMRQRDGSMMQYGRAPEADRLVRFARYRAGGGVQGNVPANRINVMLATLPYIDSVSNLRGADGGRDPETLEEAKLRAPQELRTQQRAVTAADFEDLARKASRSVGRVKVLTPGQGPSSPPPGMVEVLVVPECRDALTTGDLSRLAMPPTLAREVQRYLDDFRLLTTTLRVREPAYIGVRVFVVFMAKGSAFSAGVNEAFTQ